MRKIMILVSVVVLTLATSCGASFKREIKDISSNLSNGLDRTIRVYDSRTNETLWEYSGKGYITTDSSVGNLTVIYYDSNGESKKADFIGENISIVSFEN